jgi:hypothetical protein
MLAAAAGVSSNEANWSRQLEPSSIGEHLVHAGRRQRRRRGLQLGQRGAVRAGELLRQRRLEDGQRLPHLHGAALELAQHAEQLLGGALLDLGGDGLRVDPGDSLAEAQRGTPSEAERQRGELHGARHGATGYVGHPIIVHPLT